MTTAPRLLLPSLALALLLSACATPQSRIERNPDSFQALTAEQQALVKAGKIAIGFSEAAVKLALGEPQRITKRTTGKGDKLVWRYVDRENSNADVAFTGYYGGGPGFAGYGSAFPYYNGFYGAGVQRIYTGPGPTIERDRIRVVFTAGKVSAIEEEVK